MWATPSPMCTGSAAQGDRRRPPGGSTTTPGRRSRSGCGRIPAPHRPHTGHGSHDPRRGTPPEAACIGVTGRVVARRRPCRGAPVELVTPSATSARLPGRRPTRCAVGPCDAVDQYMSAGGRCLGSTHVLIDSGSALDGDAVQHGPGRTSHVARRGTVLVAQPGAARSILRPAAPCSGALPRRPSSRAAPPHRSISTRVSPRAPRPALTR